MTRLTPLAALGLALALAPVACGTPAPSAVESAPESAEPCRGAPCWIAVDLWPSGQEWVIEAPWSARQGKGGVGVARGEDGIDYYIAPLASRRCDPRFPTLCHYAALLWRRCSVGEPPCIPGRQLLGGEKDGEQVDHIRFLAAQPARVDEEVCPEWPTHCDGWMMLGDVEARR